MNLNLPTLLAKHEGTFWFAPSASTFAEETDSFFMIILWISTAFFIPIVIAMIWFALKFRKRPGYEGDSTALHNNALEITWSVIPTLLVCWIFVRGVQGYMDMVTPPPDTIDIQVRAKKWDWLFTYPNGATDPNLYVPKGKNVRLLMRSEDVLHSFFVPAFRTKQDIVPGRLNTIWFHPTLEGQYKLFCAEYCGDNHSEMLSDVFVLSPEKYEEKLAELSRPPTTPVAFGQWVYIRNCKSCHSDKPGVINVGPSFAEKWGKEFKTTTGETVKFDEQYVEESIRNPLAKRSADFKSNATMTTQNLTPEEIAAVQAFIKALEDGDITPELDAEEAASQAAEEGAGESSSTNETATGNSNETT